MLLVLEVADGWANSDWVMILNGLGGMSECYKGLAGHDVCSCSVVIVDSLPR